MIPETPSFIPVIAEAQIPTFVPSSLICPFIRLVPFHLGTYPLVIVPMAFRYTFPICPVASNTFESIVQTEPFCSVTPPGRPESVA